MAGMTRYSIDSDAREKAVRTVAVCSVAAAVVLNVAVISPIGSTIAAAGFGGIISPLADAGIVGSVSALAIYWLVWRWFDSRLWRWTPLAKMHGIPDLNGIWEGKGESSFKVNGSNVRYRMALSITQTFSKIECRSTFDYSRSINHIVGIHGCNAAKGGCMLEFSYLNTAGEKSVENEKWDDEHRGFSWIDCRGDEMLGKYFTNREIPTNGTFRLKRKSE